jgi:hypothetical protein
MFVVATTSGRSEKHLAGRLSVRTRDHLREVALVGLALPVLCVTALVGALDRLILSRRLGHHRVASKFIGNSTARHELAVADLAFEAHATAATAWPEMTGSFGSSRGAVRVQLGCFPTLCDCPAPLWVKLWMSELLASR